MQLDLFQVTPDNVIVAVGGPSKDPTEPMRVDVQPVRAICSNRLTATDCTIKIGPGCSDRRATFVRELPYGRCQILWPNHTITQTLIRAVVIRDGEAR